MIRKVSYGQIYQKNGHFIVPWHETDESYIFSESGLHMETRSLFSDSTLLKVTVFAKVHHGDEN
jgi:hypothetical protein